MMVKAAGFSYRDLAGLPNWNTGNHISIGTLINRGAVKYVGPATPMHGNRGGLPEYLVVKPEVNILVYGQINPQEAF